MFVTDISRWSELGAVHAEYFGDVLPVTSMIEVSALISPELLVEIEADAYVTEPADWVSSAANRPSAPGR
jgi:enamine deaminase RidA (YjgF/YER057c/UK114 family)